MQYFVRWPVVMGSTSHGGRMKTCAFCLIQPELCTRKLFWEVQVACRTLQTSPIEFWLVYTNTGDGTKQPICLKTWKLPFMFHIYIVDITCAVSVHQCLQSTGVWQVYSVVDNTVRVELVYKFPNGLEICLNEKLIEHGFADKAEESFRSQVCICQRYVSIMYIVRACHRYVCIKVCCRHLSHLHLHQGVSYMTRLGMNKRKF